MVSCFLAGSRFELVWLDCGLFSSFLCDSSLTWSPFGVASFSAVDFRLTVTEFGVSLLAPFAFSYPAFCHAWCSSRPLPFSLACYRYILCCCFPALSLVMPWLFPIKFLAWSGCPRWLGFGGMSGPLVVYFGVFVLGFLFWKPRILLPPFPELSPQTFLLTCSPRNWAPR